MNKEIAQDLISLNKPVDLDSLKKDIKPDTLKVKIISCTARNSSGKEYIEEKVNEFLSTLDHFNVYDINFQVSRNFLVGTTSGEYEEVWYCMVSYMA